MIYDDNYLLRRKRKGPPTTPSPVGTEVEGRGQQIDSSCQDKALSVAHNLDADFFSPYSHLSLSLSLFFPSLYLRIMIIYMGVGKKIWKLGGPGLSEELIEKARD